MWKSVHCAVQGRGHIKENIPCQDKTVHCEKNNTHVIALADGAGSARLSHYGADAVIKFIADDFADNFDNYFNDVDGKQVKQTIVEKITYCLKCESQQRGCHIKDLASTLLVVAIKEDRIIILHIGDGVIGYLKEGQLKVASGPANGEFANSTIFTTSSDALTSMKLIKSHLSTISGFVLMSDGTEASMYNKRENIIANGIKKLLNMLIYVSEYQMTELVKDSFESIVRSATFDDCSINLLVNDRMFHGYLSLTLNERAEILKLNKKSTGLKTQINKYNKLLACLICPKTVSQLAKEVYIKEKYLRKHIIHLQECGFVIRRGNKFKTIISM